MRIRLPGLVFLSIGLSGCVISQPAPPPAATVPPPVNYAAPRPAPVAPIQPGGTQAVHVVAKSGVPLRIDFLADVHADCTSAGVATIQLTSKPLHGSVDIATVDDYPNFLPTNQRYECNKMKVPGVETHYRSEKGYVGTDTFTESIVLPTGMPFQRVVTVNVE